MQTTVTNTHRLYCRECGCLAYDSIDVVMATMETHLRYASAELDDLTVVTADWTSF